MSPHVGSRFYRAPEVICLQNYDQTQDVWSFGCIVYELESATKNKKRNFLFKGDSCYPLSQVRKDLVSSNDQFIKILEKIGTDQDVSQYNKEGQGYFKKVTSNMQPFGTGIKVNDPEFSGLIKEALKFTSRQSAAELLRNPMFDKIRVNALEISECEPIYLEIDQLDSQTFSLEKLMEMLEDEIQTVKTVSAFH